MDNIKVWDKEAVQNLLEVSDKAVARAILAIYSRQTSDEKVAGETRVHNERGFTAYDAPFLSSIAQRLPQYGNRLTPRQLAKTRPKMRKYWRQLLEEIESKGGRVSYTVRSQRSLIEIPPGTDPVVTPGLPPAQHPVSRPAQYGLF